MPAIVVIIQLVAAAAWVVAGWSLLSLVSLAPAGGRFATLTDVGWWRFAAVEARIGAGARVHIDRYRKAFVAFFLCILAGAVAAFAFTAIDAPAS